MMKKRKSPLDPHQDEDSSEMDVDDEEKVEMAGEDDNDEADSDDEADEDEMEEDRNPAGEDNSFLDTFYGLSSSDPSERAQAANALLHHCLLGPDANVKDAAYAFKRLLNGICSGRAAARQGNASALATFLKIALEGGQLEEIKSQQEEGTETKNNEEESILGYVRHRLLNATDPIQTQGKKKNSEERDYHFGRLFGILSVARSGILLPDDKEGGDLDDVIHVASGFVSDLVKLFHLKKWMKEPAAHAIGTILNTFYAVSDKANGKKVVAHLVEQVVIPKVLLGESGNFSLAEYSPEQVAIAANIQSHIEYHPKGLPSPLDEPILSPETIPLLAKTLEATSSVVQPRIHLVWDSIWLFLTELDNSKSGKTKGLRKLRSEPPLGSSSIRDTVESLVRHIVVEGLLKQDSNQGKATHERRALAICIVRNLLGVPFNSSISGPTELQLETDDLEQIVLTPILIRRLFFDVISAGSGAKSKAHHLKPLALQVLESVVNTMTQDSSEAGMKRRLVAAQCFVRCEPRFDHSTKTTTVLDLVGLNDANDVGFGPSHVDIWQKYVDFLEEQLISAMQSDTESGGKVMGYIDLLHNAAKRFLRLEVGKDAETTNFVEFRTKAVNNVLNFFMVSSFFDCAKVSAPDTRSSSKKSKKGKKREQNQEIDPFVNAALRQNQLKEKCRGGTKSPLPYDARSALSERFFALLNDTVTASIHHPHDSKEETVHAKDSIMLSILSDLCKGWQSLEANGAKPFFSAAEGSGEGSSSPETVVSQLQGLAKDLSEKDSDDAQTRAHLRCATGCAVLASSLFLHLLGCGRPDHITEEQDVTTEDDDDSADIVDAIEEIGEITTAFLGGSFEDDQNPLAGFAELCISVLSSSICSNNPGRGASPKLIHEAVKFAWMGALTSSAHTDRILLDPEVISVLLSGIGATDGSLQGNEHPESDEEEGESEDDEDDDESSGGDLEGDFSKLGNILGDGEDIEDEPMADEENEPGSNEADDGDQDVEIDPDRLNSLLEEDSDADVDAGELEHHEGADAALAQLIKLKQEARKASRQARERLELAKQTRCTLLIETLLGRSDGWSALLRSDVLLQLVSPLLSYRNELEKALSRTSGKADSSVKRGLLERLTKIMKQKLFKVKLSNIPASDSTDIVEFSCNLASELMNMARKSSSKEQIICCSGALNLVFKAIPSTDGILKAASVYSDAMEEWTAKRKLDAYLFDDLIHHNASLAQAVLIGPLASAATSTRPFMKSECFRLLAALYNPKLNPHVTDLDKHAYNKTKELGPKVVACICETLKDEDMQKPKRVREVLKTTHQVLVFAKSTSSSFTNLDDLSKAMTKLDSKLGNKAIHDGIEKLNSTIESLKSGISDDKEDEEMEEVAGGNEEPGGKKGKKKKKKKKKGKKK